jgi:S-DNA-T family DNA segregation ATPase FtsK/SpoIIIE
MEWLPHTSQMHQGGGGDLLAFDSDNIHHLLSNLSQIIDERKAHPDSGQLPHLFVIFDGMQLAEGEPITRTILRDGASVGVSAICLVNSVENAPSECHAVVQVEPDGRFQYARVGAGSFTRNGRAADELSLQDAEYVARALSAITLREASVGGRIPRQVDFLELYTVHDVNELKLRLGQRWRRPINQGVLPHPITIGRESLAVDTEMLLDEDHHGPHGVLAGTTGAGKSELLQSMICALAVEHDPRLVNFLLIDFKGGSAFNIFSNLPHTVGMITNLDGTLIERALEALKAETQARQQFLKKMNVRDITQYHRFNSRSMSQIEDAAYSPLPHLFVIVDEFAQLAREMPDFMHELVRTAQVGRSLGLHLILGTQSPMDVITDEMNANLQFRICLRVQNIESSRAMIRRPDAAYLPIGWPGRGYFQVGERGLFKQFQAAYVGSDFLPQQPQDAQTGESISLELITNHGMIDLLPASDEAQLTHIAGDEPYTVAHAISDMLASYARENGIPNSAPLLLPPLEERISLREVFNRAGGDGWNGRVWLLPGVDQHGELIKTGSAPIGLIDDVYNRTQEPLWVHLNTSDHEHTKDGHLLVLGGSGTGKTTLLKTLALSLALLHAPERLHLYFLSFTGAGLNDISELPHAERVIQGTESERVRRLFRRLMQTLNERQTNPEALNGPTIVVFIDQYEQFRDAYYEQHMADFNRLVNEGRTAGIYLVVTASSLAALPERTRSLILQRIVLQLGNTADMSAAVGHIEQHLEGTLPRGRGYIPQAPPLLVQIALPSTIDRIDEDADVLRALRQVVDGLRQGYAALQGLDARRTPTEQTQNPAPIGELPLKIPLNSLPLAIPSPSLQATSPPNPLSASREGEERGHILTTLGKLDDDRLQTFRLDWTEDGPHFVVAGAPGTGKTNLLQAAVLSAAGAYSPQDLRFLLVDFSGRSLRALDGLKHVMARVMDATALEAQLSPLEAALENITPDMPHTVIVIDDYDATSETLLASGGQALKRLRDLARLPNEAGVHFWVAGYMERTGDLLLRQLLLHRSGFGLCSRESLGVFGIRTNQLPAEIMPEGRAYFAQHNQIAVVQTALVENAALMVNRLNQQVWGDIDVHTLRQKNPHPYPPPYRGEGEKRESLSLPPTEDVDRSEENGLPPLEIDTAGLIADLMNASPPESEEKKSEPIPPQPKTRKRRGKKAE